MLNVTEHPVPGARQIANGGFGNRCVIDGSFFDEGGICNYGHEQGKTYYVIEEKEKPQTKKEKKETIMVTCQAINGIKCNLCPGIFPDGDDMCINGHEIGSQYEVEKK